MQDMRDIAITEDVQTLPRQPQRITTTLYELMSTLQTTIPEDHDDLVVSLVAQWLASGRLRFLGARAL